MSPYAGFTGDLNADGSAGNQDHTGLLLSTSSFLPPDQFPGFAGSAPLGWDIPGGPFDPHDGRLVRLQPAGGPDLQATHAGLLT